MPSHAIGPARFTFLFKAAAALLLVSLADLLFFDHEVGSTIGVFAIAWVVALATGIPSLRKDGKARVALAAAAGFGLALAYDPSLLGVALFWTAVTLAALLPRVTRFGNAGRWLGPLALQGLSGPFAPIVDAFRLSRSRARGQRRPLRSVLPILVLPIVGGAVFLLLFSLANPLIANAFAALELPSPSFDTILRLLFWGVVLVAVWSNLRPRALVTAWGMPEGERDLALPSVSLASITLSLIVFNAIFALQNGLDIAFLWSGAPLPEGVTLAEYAHRGAYALIVTALLAGLFVLVALRPGSQTAERPLVRRLVIAWVAQNLLLVASSILRTMDYVDVFSLTRLRIAAFAWMVLVAIGLVLICWRMLANKSAAWLINGNVAVAAALLAGASIVDLGAVAAQWNVRHAREAGGRGAALDLCYLNDLGASALLSLAELERRPLQPAFRERVAAVRGRVLARTQAGQADWRGWIWRDARRLGLYNAVPRPAGRALDVANPRDCHGRLFPRAVATPAPRPAVAAPPARPAS